jgi:hypothetical protein
MYELFILISIIGTGVVLAVIQVVRSRKCLEDSEIRDYLTRQFDRDSEESRKVTRHLGTCEKCQKRLTDFKFKSD